MSDKTLACKDSKHDMCGTYTWPDGQMGDPQPCGCVCHLAEHLTTEVYVGIDPPYTHRSTGRERVRYSGGTHSTDHTFYKTAKGAAGRRGRALRGTITWEEV